MKYYSHGKLLISGEYLVLNGALSLAVPVRFGQSLEYQKKEAGKIMSWVTYMLGKKIFEAEIEIPNLKIIHSTNSNYNKFLQEILKAAIDLNPGQIEEYASGSIVTSLNYNINWGLGSSATLISNIAYLMDIDPFDLHWKVSRGSGYDIACARSEKAVTYKLCNNKPEINYLGYKPSFHSQLYFIYTGKKQDSQASVKEYLKSSRVADKEIEKASDLTRYILNANDLDEFEECIREHELLISKIINKEPIKKERFPDFNGEIKSLGAWGGDFILVTCRDGEHALRNYFYPKQMKAIYTFDSLILN